MTPTAGVEGRARRPRRRGGVGKPGDALGQALVGHAGFMAVMEASALLSFRLAACGLLSRIGSQGGCTSVGLRCCETSPMEPSARSTVRRLAERAEYGADTIASVLDAGVVAHVGISYQGAPVVIPMAYARVGDIVYVHGSTASRIMRALKTGDAMCITVTIVDGIVLARSAFNMSMNYRSVVIHGHARLISDLDERMTAFRAIMDHLVPGHWGAVRAPNDIELRQTLVVGRRARRDVGKGARRTVRGRGRGSGLANVGRRDPVDDGCRVPVRGRRRTCGSPGPAVGGEVLARLRSAGASVV